MSNPRTELTGNGSHSDVYIQATFLKISIQTQTAASIHTQHTVAVLRSLLGAGAGESTLRQSDLVFSYIPPAVLAQLLQPAESYICARY